MSSDARPRGTRPRKKPPVPGSFGEAVRSIREEKGISQIELGKRTGMGQNNISRIETGAVFRPQEVTVRQLAEGLGVTPNEIWERTSFPELSWQTEELRKAIKPLGIHAQDILTVLAVTMGKSKNKEAIDRLVPERVRTWFEAALDMQRLP